MRILICSVGTRGDVQPAAALALQVHELGAQVRLCVPPNFVDWISGQGFEARPMGVEMRAPRAGAAPPVSIPDLIADQFETVAAAAEDCDLIVGAGVHQYAVRSIAALRGIPSVIAVYAPTSLPSADTGAWQTVQAQWNQRFLQRVNANRQRVGLDTVDDLLTHILGHRPWLAADRVLAPPTPGMSIEQTGAWLLPDRTPLPAELEAFLAAGDPPVYVGFGSMPASGDLSGVLIAAVRAVGRRVLLSEGWAGLGLVDAGSDCFAIGDVNHQTLFTRVAAVMHHGGAGTTVAAARAGVPQVVAPMFADQFYWADRVAALGLGVSLRASELTAPSLAERLREALMPAVAERSRAVAAEITVDGAAVAARRLVEAAG